MSVSPYIKLSVGELNYVIEDDIPSTIAAAPKTIMIPPITDPAIGHDIRPVIQANPKKTTAIIAKIRAHVPVSSVSRAVRKFVPLSNKAAEAACAESGAMKIIEPVRIESNTKLRIRVPQCIKYPQVQVKK